jgi:hypothetical protein
MKSILWFLIISLGFFSSFIINRFSGSIELNKLYYLLSLSPFLDFSINSNVFQGEHPRKTLKLQLFVGILSFLCLVEYGYFFLFVFSRQLLQTYINFYTISSLGNIEQILRILMGVQLFFAGTLSILIDFKTSILILSIINLILVIWFYFRNPQVKHVFENDITKQNNFLLKYFQPILSRLVKKGNASIILGSIFMSNLFLIIESQYSIYLVLGLQILNAATNFYHLFKKNRYFETHFLHFLEKINYSLIYLILISCSFLVIHFTGKLNLVFNIISIVIFGEIGLIHISNKRLLKSDFKFVYRLAVVVIIQYLYLKEFLSIEILLLSCAFIYYYISFKYGEKYILDSGAI